MQAERKWSATTTLWTYPSYRWKLPGSFGQSSGFCLRANPWKHSELAARYLTCNLKDICLGRSNGLKKLSALSLNDSWFSTIYFVNFYGVQGGQKNCHSATASAWKKVPEVFSVAALPIVTHRLSRVVDSDLSWLKKNISCWGSSIRGFWFALIFLVCTTCFDV